MKVKGKHRKQLIELLIYYLRSDDSMANSFNESIIKSIRRSIRRSIINVIVIISAAL